MTHPLTDPQLRSTRDDLIIYQPYQSPIEGSKDTSLRFLKIPNPHLPRTPKEELVEVEETQQERRQPLRSLQDVGGYSAVFMPGQSPSFIIKAASSPPGVIEMCDDSVKSLTQLHSPICLKGFLYIDGEVSRAGQNERGSGVLIRPGHNPSSSTSFAKSVRVRLGYEKGPTW